MMRRREEIIPVYLVTGFLESGKTDLIHSMFKDESFTRTRQRTLIISCEEGETPYDQALLQKHDAVVEVLEEPEELTGQRLMDMTRKHKPQRIFIEYNNIWGLELLGNTPLPAAWEIVQVITLADANTFDSYMTNMRKLITDPMKEADLIVVNRCGPAHNKSAWRKQLRALNPRCNILFENLDGSAEDGVADEDLPYDMKANVIDIAEEHMGTFYIDSMEHPERYDGKTVRLTGEYFQDKGFPKGFSMFGRMAMTCCADDIAPVGWICQYRSMYSAHVFVRLTAKCQTVEDAQGKMLVLHEVSSEKGQQPREKYMIFN